MSEQLSADLNIIQSAPIELELLDGDLNIIQKLDDEPNDVGGLTSAELKAKFDESGNIIKKYINETLIPAVLAEDATEESRKQAEAARVAAEQVRQSNEAARQNAESQRVNAENARNVWEDYSASKSYAVGNKVASAGSSYLCIKPCTGITPPNAEYWRLIAAKGDKGGTGPRGRQGEQGIQGPEGPVGGSSNFVRYDAAQTLTDAQKTQARGNINAAPGGFGYGEYRAFKKWDDNDGSQFEAFVDQMIDGTGKVVRLADVADYPANVVSGNSGFADIQITYDGSVLVLFHGPVNVLEGSIDGVYHASKKRLLNGTWLPWEYDNPPLALGVEYRTTERYLGKPVYCKLVNFGALPNATQKVVKHNIPNVSSVISVYGSAQDQAIVVGAFGMQVTGINADNTNVAIWTSADLSNYSAYVAMKYTKITD